MDRGSKWKHGGSKVKLPENQHQAGNAALTALHLHARTAKPAPWSMLDIVIDCLKSPRSMLSREHKGGYKHDHTWSCTKQAGETSLKVVACWPCMMQQLIAKSRSRPCQYPTTVTDMSLDAYCGTPGNKATVPSSACACSEW